MGVWLQSNNSIYGLRDGTAPEHPMLGVGPEQPTWFERREAGQHTHDRDIRVVDRPPPPDDYRAPTLAELREARTQRRAALEKERADKARRAQREEENTATRAAAALELKRTAERPVAVNDRPVVVNVNLGAGTVTGSPAEVGRQIVQLLADTKPPAPPEGDDVDDESDDEEEPEAGDAAAGDAPKATPKPKKTARGRGRGKVEADALKGDREVV